MRLEWRERERERREGDPFYMERTRHASKMRGRRTFTMENVSTHRSGRSTCFFFVLSFLLTALSATSPTGAIDPLDLHANITLNWDIRSWTDDGYNALVTIHNYQQYRHIDSPGWSIGWSWAGREIIWEMVGAEAKEQGDCSRFKGTNIPHSCAKRPEIVDLLPSAPYNMRTGNCCRGGVLSSMVQDRHNAFSNFQIRVGRAGTSKKKVVMPTNFSLKGPGPGYTCSPPQAVPPTSFPTADGRRHTQSLATWRVICTYSQYVAHPTPVCCVSFSAFYNDTIIPCPACSCGCHDTAITSKACIRGEFTSPLRIATARESPAPLVRCTPHMCPIKIHWHVKSNYVGYWRVKITIMNFSYKANYSQWNVVVQHSKFNTFSQVFSFNYKVLNKYRLLNDTVALWGIKYYNDVLLQAGAMGHVQSEILLKKNVEGRIAMRNGMVFPERVYFNGDECVLPPPDAYPWLPQTFNPTRQIGESLVYIASIIAGSSFFILLYCSCKVVW